MKYRIADLFCGAGGTSEGAMEAVSFLGRNPELTAILHCRSCGTDKPARQFYVSSLSICMDCKREKVNAYKRRTGYNLNYRLRKEVAA